MSIQQTIKDMKDEDLNQLFEAAATEREGRRQGFDLAKIRPGMTAEEMQAARAEISRAMKESGLRG